MHHVTEEFLLTAILESIGEDCYVLLNNTDGGLQRFRNVKSARRTIGASSEDQDLDRASDPFGLWNFIKVHVNDEQNDPYAVKQKWLNLQHKINKKIPETGISLFLRSYNGKLLS